MSKWKSFEIKRPGGQSSVCGEYRHMGFSTFVDHIVSNEDEDDKVIKVLEKCTRNLSVPKKEWEQQVANILFDTIYGQTAEKYPQDFNEFMEKYNQGKVDIGKSFYSTMETYICACFNYMPKDLDDMDEDEIFRRYQQACLIFPEQKPVHPEAAKIQANPQNTREEHFCTECNRKAQNCLKKEVHRKKWVRTN